MKYIITILFICFNYYAFSQIRLANIEVSTCENDPQFFKLCPNYKLTRINDSLVQIQTQIISNCIGVHNPRIKEYGPVINLDFDDFTVDSINPFTKEKELMRKQYDCICSFKIKWDIYGIKENAAYVYLIRGGTFKNYDSKLLDEILISYDLNQGRLLNVIDKNENKQWRHESMNGDSRDIHFYIDGILDK